MSQDELDRKIAEGVLWGALPTMYGPNVSVLRHEDGTPVLEEDTISFSEVPADSELFITPEIAYYMQS